MGRRQPHHPLPGPGQGRQGRQDELQLADPVLAAEDFSDSAPGPAAARQLGIKGRKAGRQRRRGELGRPAEPDGVPLQDLFEGRHRYCIFIQYRRGV